jgi:ATP-dependent DNA helicase RecG
VTCDKTHIVEVDLDETLIRKTVAMALNTGRWQGDVNDPKSFLYSLGLLTHSDITNAGAVLFGTKVARWFPQVRIRFVVMPTGKTGDAYEDDATFEGNLFAIAKEAFQRLTRYTGTLRTKFHDDALRREEAREYPPTAIREAVMNSIIHRDYSRSGSILIAMLPTSLKISNPGALPEELTVADLKKDHPSIPRNPDIAHVCYLGGLIEKVGRGTQRIVEDCRRNHLRDPKWTSSESETTLTFFARTQIAKRLDDLNDRQKLILQALQKQGYLSSRNVSDVLGKKVTGRTVRSDLRLLVDRGLIIQRGRGRSTSYSPGRSLE